MKKNICYFLAAILICSIVYVRLRGTNDPELRLEYRYLLVSVEANDDWRSSHDVYISFDDEPKMLPVVFRLKGDDSRDVGAGAESDMFFSIGKLDIRIEVEPSDPVRVSNELAFAVIRDSEKAGNNQMSIASWVTVAPSSTIGRTNPIQLSGAVNSNNEKIAIEIKKCLRDGKVIDVR